MKGYKVLGYALAMIEETVAKIEQAIRRAGQGDTRHRAEFVRLLERLKTELKALPSSQGEKARSIAHFVEAAVHEAARRDKSAKLLKLSRGALKESVVDFEVSHPQLTGVVGEICVLLSGIGV